MANNYVGYIDIFSENECIDIVNRIDSLRREWINMGDPIDSSSGSIGYPPLWTLGAASYRDVNKSLKLYHRLAEKENKTLFNNFYDVYEKLLNKLTPIIGSCYLEEDLALPGFHIFAQKNDIKNKVSVDVTDKLFEHIHRDQLYEWHYELLSKKYSVVDTSEIISITVSLMLPKNGSGLCVWDESAKHLDSSENFAEEIKKNKIYKDYPDGDPYIVTYKLGSAFCFSGESNHQISPICTAYPGDRRITLQAHGMICDDAWRLFF